jgi:competence protein ComEC
MAEYFHRISFTGLSANLIIVPLLEAAVPIGFFAIFSGWNWAAAIAGWLLKIAARTADWHAHIEPSWRVTDPPPWLAFAFTASLIVFALLARHRRGRWFSGVAVMALFVLLLWQPWPAKVIPGTLELTAIDVGQGDSLLVVFPEGRRIVIDGGGVLQFGRRRRKPNLDTGEDVVSPYLWSREIRRIDVLVATHAHEDHSGGIAALMENFRPRELWVGANPAPALVERARQLHIPTVAMHASISFDFSGARIEVLSPPAEYAAKTPGNNDSLAFRIAYGERAFLLTGDMERPMEQRLLDDRRLTHADVLKVGHHGSKTSTTEPFLTAVSPAVAVISAGYGNSFGHPHRDILARLEDHHAAVLRTDLDGLVTVRTDGHGLTLDSMSWHEASPGIAFSWAMAAGP